MMLYIFWDGPIWGGCVAKFPDIHGYLVEPNGQTKKYLKFSMAPHIWVNHYLIYLFIIFLSLSAATPQNPIQNQPSMCKSQSDKKLMVKLKVIAVIYLYLLCSIVLYLLSHLLNHIFNSSSNSIYLPIIHIPIILEVLLIRCIS